MNPREERHLNLKGDKTLMYYCKPGDPSFTHYAGFHNGSQVLESRKAEMLDTFTTSIYHTSSPDPVLLRRSKEHDLKLQNDVFKIEERIPNLSAALTMSSTFKKPGTAPNKASRRHNNWT